MADIILVAIIAVFALRGAKRGFARSVVGMISTVLSIVVGTLLYRGVSGIIYSSVVGEAVRKGIESFLAENTSGAVSGLINMQGGLDVLTMLSVNAISFVVVIILSKIIVSFIAGAVNIASRLPLIKQANSLMGMAVGILSGCVFCYIGAGVLSAMGANFPSLIKMIESSVIARLFYENNVITSVLSAFIK